MYSFIDWAKELGNFYKDNLQIFDKFALEQGFNQKEFETIFKDKLSFEAVKHSSFAQIVNENELSKGTTLLASFFIDEKSIKLQVSNATLLGKTYGFDANLSGEDKQEFDRFMQKYQLQSANNIQKSSFKNITSDEYMGVFKEQSKLKSFTSYALDFKLPKDIIEQAKAFETEFDTLIGDDSLSLEEFKQKYLDFKTRHDEFVKAFDEALGKALKNNSQNDISNNNDNTSSKTTPNNTLNISSKTEENLNIQNPFTPISAKSLMKPTKIQGIIFYFKNF